MKKLIENWRKKSRAALFFWGGEVEEKIRNLSFFLYVKFCNNAYQMDTVSYLCIKNKIMEVITAREFRANQSKYFGKASKGEDIILKSRGLGSFRLVPVTSDDSVINKPDLTERLSMALREVQLMREGKIKELSMQDLLDEL